MAEDDRPAAGGKAMSSAEGEDVTPSTPQATGPERGGVEASSPSQDRPDSESATPSTSHAAASSSTAASVPETPAPRRASSPPAAGSSSSPTKQSSPQVPTLSIDTSATPLAPRPPTLLQPTQAESALPLTTPAPHRAVTPLAPSKPVAATPDLAPTPGMTPGTAPNTGGMQRNTSLRARPELAEFDPFATPAPAPAKAKPKKTRSPERTRTSLDTPSASQQSPRTSTERPRISSESGRGERSEDRGSMDTPRRPRRGDSTASTEEAPFNFAGFLRDLRSKPAEPVARFLKSFLTNFAKKPFMVSEQIKLIRDFLSFISDKMRAVEPWKSQSDAEFDNALEAMEKLVMNRLYPYTYTPQLHDGATITTDDLERDAVFAQRVRLFSWVQERHLDVPAGEAAQGFLGFAEQELLKINHYKAPRDKMICILNSCKVIFGLIRHTMGNSAGADAFVPILIFVVLRANPENMLSNVEYINRFRNPDKLTGEAGYYLSSLQGAIAFIETMDASSLSNITQEEFEHNVEKAIQALPVSPSSPRARSKLPADMSPFATSPGEEPARPLALPATAAALDGTKRFFHRTGEAAKDVMSRPLTAITRILDNMQPADGSESGDEDVVESWRPGGSRDHEHESTPSRLLAQLGISQQTPAPSEGVTREPTPEGHAHLPQPPVYYDHYAEQQQMQNTLEASHDDYVREQARAANVLTLQQMFPDLDEEIVDSVLYACSDDLGAAIDTLLEM